MKRPTILIIDDDPLTRKLVRATLQSEGYNVLAAEDGRSALEVVGTQRPDLVLQDLILPDMDGFELVRRLRGLPGCAKLPILALSGFTSKVGDARQLHTGFTGYILKPVEPSELLTLIQGYLVPAGAFQQEPGRGRRILVVDDDPLQRKLMRIRLEQAGFTVATAEDGADALDQARRSRPEAILSDMLMPRLDGLKLCLAVRQDPRLAGTPVVLTSAATIDEADRRLAESVGANAFVPRTPDLQDVIDALVAALEKGAAVRQVPPVVLPAAEYAERTARQLGRQTTISAGLAQRLAWIEAKLAILGGLAETLKRSTPTEPLIDEILYRALEATGAPRGAAYLLEPDGRFSLRTESGYHEADTSRLADFFGRTDLLHRAVKEGLPVEVPSERVPEAEAAGLLEQAGARSMLITPLLSREEKLGVLAIGWTSIEREGDWRSILTAVVSQVSQAIALAQALSQLRESEERLQHLQTIADTALAHLTLEDLLPDLLKRISKALVADTVAILLLEGDSLVAHAASGLEEEVRRGVRIPIDKGFAGRVFSQRRPVIIEDLARARLANPVLREKGVRSLLGVPLIVDNRAIGVLHVGTLRPRRFSNSDAQLLQLVADRVASAMDRAQLYRAEQQARAEAEAAQRRLAFLARASAALSESLDYETTLANVVKLAVPDLADWCAVEVMGESGSIRRLAVGHADPTKVEQARVLEMRFLAQGDEAYGVAEVMRTGKSQFYPEVSPTQLAAAVHDPEHLELLRRIGPKSAMVVPVAVRGEVLAAVTFAMAESGRRYGEADLALAEELARRYALALDNARLYREAQSAVGMRDEFLSIAAHELRTPITSLRGFAQAALRQMEKTGTLDPARVCRVLEVMDHQSGRLARLVSQLLDVSRLEAGKLVLEREVVDVSGLVEGVVAGARARTGRDNLVVHAKSPMPALVDPLRLEQVVTNLVDNAIKYSPNGKPIDVEVQLQSPGTVRLSVRDRGVGIPAEKHEQVFERFYQSQSGHLGGMGLGLYVTRGIVELHGGRIWVESPPDGGARFVVTLPAGAAEGNGSE